MITLVRECLFKDLDNIYKRFHIQILKSSDFLYSMVVINFDGYDTEQDSLQLKNLNEDLFFNHLNKMFGIQNPDNYEIFLIQNDVKYKRIKSLYNSYSKCFLSITEREFNLKYNEFLKS